MVLMINASNGSTAKCGSAEISCRITGGRAGFDGLSIPSPFACRNVSWPEEKDGAVFFQFEIMESIR